MIPLDTTNNLKLDSFLKGPVRTRYSAFPQLYLTNNENLHFRSTTNPLD